MLLNYSVKHNSDLFNENMHLNYSVKYALELFSKICSWIVQ